MTPDEEELIDHYTERLKTQLSGWRRRKGSYKEYEKIIKEHINGTFYSGKASKDNWKTV